MGRWKVVEVRIFLALCELVPLRAAFFATSAFFFSPGDLVGRHTGKEYLRKWTSLEAWWWIVVMRDFLEIDAVGLLSFKQSRVWNARSLEKP